MSPDPVPGEAEIGSPIARRARAHRMGALAGLSFVAGTVDRLLGFVLTALIASLFGATAEGDAYFLALIVPVVLGAVLTEAFYTALIPMFAGADQRLLSLRLRTALVTAIRVAAMLAALYVAALIALQPSELGIWLAVSPIVLTAAVSGVYAASLVTQGRLLLATMRVPLATGLSALLVAALVPFEPSTPTVALSLSIGSIVSLVVLAAASGSGHREQTADSISLRDLVAGVASASMVFLVAGPLTVVLERIFASALPDGSVALLTFARALALLPLLLVAAVANGIFPTAAERHHELDLAGLRRLTILAVRLATVAMLVSVAYVVISGREIVRVALERGAVGEATAHMVSRLTIFLVFSLVGLSMLLVGSRVLFAMGRSRFVAISGGAGASAYVVVAPLLGALRGVEGLAVAYSVSALLAGIVTLGYLIDALGLAPKAVLRDWVIAPVALATAFAGGALVAELLPIDTRSFWGALASLTVSLLFGVVSLLTTILLARGAELDLLRRLIALHLRAPVGSRSSPR